MQDPRPITPTIVQVVKEPPSPQISMIDVALGAFGLTGAIMVAALVAGLIAGVVIVWYRTRRPITIIEARGGDHNLFRA